MGKEGGGVVKVPTVVCLRHRISHPADFPCIWCALERDRWATEDRRRKRRREKMRKPTA